MKKSRRRKNFFVREIFRKFLSSKVLLNFPYNCIMRLKVLFDTLPKKNNFFQSVKAPLKIFNKDL